MFYRFPLTWLYRADYKDNAWLFSGLNQQDLYRISGWISATVGGSEATRRRIHHQLLQEFSTTEKLLQPTSRMLTVYNQRICWIETAPISQSFAATELFLTAHPALLQDYRAALILWRRTTNYILSFATWNRLCVSLGIGRDIEAQALKKIGYKEEGEYYVFDLLDEFNILLRNSGVTPI